MESEHFYAVILAGGGGTRLWPKSRKKFPKHFLKLYGDKTLLQQTFDRIEPVINPKKIFLITLKDYVPEVKKQLPSLLEENIIAEPQAKNTALAMGVVSAYIRKRDPEAVVVNLAADHLFEDEEKFREVILSALRVAAEDDHIVAIGIKPSFAHTGLGYIKIGDELEEFKDKNNSVFVFKGLGFKEKPDLTTAQSFLSSGQYLWNANLYCWSVSTIQKAMLEHSPELAKGIEQIFSSIGTKQENKTVEEVYEGAENVQIDVAVSEKAKNLVVIPGDFGWSDVGDWKVIYETHKKDEAGNVLLTKGGEFFPIDTKNSLIQTNGRPVVTIGLDDVVVIDTDDALLVCNKSRSQDVKKAIELLKDNGSSSCL